MSRVVSNVSHITLALPITKRVTRRSNRSNERRKQKREIGRRQTGTDWSRTIGLYERSLRDMNSAAFADGWTWYRRPEFSWLSHHAMNLIDIGALVCFVKFSKSLLDGTRVIRSRMNTWPWKLDRDYVSCRSNGSFPDPGETCGNQPPTKLLIFHR